MKDALTIVGARPQFVKAAVVSKALADLGISETIIHTGQHYDHEMSTVFFEELNIPAPEKNLGVGSTTHGKQTGQMMEQLESLILNATDMPKALMVYGDTNSTLAGALVASKLHIPVIHVEAGLRSHNRSMPEEINRVLTDHISDLLFCSSEEPLEQLKSEGITKGVHLTGDVMYDVLLQFSTIAESKFGLEDVVTGLEPGFVLATIHRPSNTDQPDNLRSILNAFGDLPETVVWPVHPRNNDRLKEYSLPDNLITIGPVSYFKMMVLLKRCSLVITDSGGLQKEAYWMKKRCVTFRKETEWVETLNGNWNTLTGPDRDKIVSAYHEEETAKWKPLYGDGKAASKIASRIKDLLG